MKLQYLLLLMFMVSALSCQFAQRGDDSFLLGTWRLQSVKKSSVQKAGSDQLLQEANENSLAQEGMALSLFADHQFTLIEGDGGYYFGKWSLGENNQQFLLQTGTKRIHANVEGTGKDRQLLLHDFPIAGEMRLVLFAGPLAKQSEDQFYPPNNTWRIKPSAPEDTVAIKKRLGNYIQHMAYLLKSANLRNQSVVSFEFSMGPIRIYNGGLGVISLNKVPDSWKHAFYDNQQAAIAHELYADAIQQTHYKGASTGKWVEDDYHLLLALYKQLLQ